MNDLNNVEDIIREEDGTGTLNPDYDREAPLLLCITDSATGEDMILCNRPECKHDSLDCNAFIPFCEFELDESGVSYRSNSRMRLTQFLLFIDNDYIYAKSDHNTIYRFNLDGTGRTEHIRIPDEYHCDRGNSWLMNGKLYITSYVMDMISEFEIASHQTLLEIDYNKKTVRELWQQDYHKPYSNQDPAYAISIHGAWNGKFFLTETSYPEFVRNLDGYRKYEDTTEITIFSIDPKLERSKSKEIIHSDTGDGFAPNMWGLWGAAVPQFYYHSRREEAVYLFDLLTGKKTKIAENTSGYMSVDGEVDGRLFVTQNMDMYVWGYDRTDGSDVGKKFFIDVKTGEVTESTLRMKSGFHISILYDEDDYYYIETDNKTGKHSQYDFYQFTKNRLGRIPKEDYWANNAEAIEELDWYDNDDWNEMLFNLNR